MRVVHVTESLQPEYGGPARSVPDLVAYLGRCGIEATLLATESREDPGYELVEQYRLDYRLARVPRAMRVFPLGRWYFAPDLPDLLADAVASADLLHLNGLWTYPGWTAWRVAHARQIPLVYSARASLYPESLAFHGVRKKIAWKLYVRRLLESCAFIHATADAEVEVLREIGLNNPIALVPNGVNTEEFDRTIPKAEARTAMGLPTDARYMLFLARIMPSKRLDWLIRAWAEVRDRHPEWRLLIAGHVEDRGHFSQVRREIARLGLADRTHHLGLLGKDERIQALFASDLFVVPTRLENFGTAISEALAARRPVITTRGTPWKSIADEGAGWWIEHSESALVQALEQAQSMPSDRLEAMGDRGREIVDRMNRARQAERMAEAYRWVVDQEERPEFLHLFPGARPS